MGRKRQLRTLFDQKVDHSTNDALASPSVLHPSANVTVSVVPDGDVAQFEGGAIVLAERCSVAAAMHKVAGGGTLSGGVQDFSGGLLAVDMARQGDCALGQAIVTPLLNADGRPPFRYPYPPIPASDNGTVDGTPRPGLWTRMVIRTVGPECTVAERKTGLATCTLAQYRTYVDAPKERPEEGDLEGSVFKNVMAQFLAYRNCLRRAFESDVKSVAFPSLVCENVAFEPKAIARIAYDALSEVSRMPEHASKAMHVWFVMAAADDKAVAAQLRLAFEKPFAARFA